MQTPEPVCDTPAPLPPTHRNNRLTFKQHLFINAYMDAFTANGGDVKGCQRAAYLAIHPKAKPESADVLASRLLAMVKVQTEIARRIRYSRGITLEECTSDLLLVREKAILAEDWDLLDENTLLRLKLGGWLVEKREVKTITDEQRNAIRQLVESSFGAPN